MSKTIKELKEELKNKISYQEGLGKPTYEDVLEDFYYDETDDTNDYETLFWDVRLKDRVELELL